MSGKYTSKFGVEISYFTLLTLFFILFLRYLSWLHLTSLVYVKPFLSGSTLSGNHGVPRVHYKGKQGDFYIMVLSSSFRFVLRIRTINNLVILFGMHAGYGYVGTKPVGCLE